MAYMDLLGDEILRDAEMESDEENTTPDKKTSKDRKSSGIFGLAKNGSETTQCLSSTTKVAINLEMLNREIAEVGKGDFYTAFLKDNMFQKIRNEITEYQGR